jgi:hypothetical protein
VGPRLKIESLRSGEGFPAAAFALGPDVVGV